MTAHLARVADFRFIVEPGADADDRRRDASELLEVPVGRGVRALDLESLASDPRLEATRRGRGFRARALHFEPLTVDRRPTLLMLTPPGVRTRVNGRPSPSLALLEVGDQLQVGDTVLHLTQYREFAVGPPPPELLGRRCGVCRVPFDRETRVYLHDCGAALHLEPESKPAEERLECALLGDCPNCGEPISMEPGYSFLPEI
jgi:hypothetical protein